MWYLDTAPNETADRVGDDPNPTLTCFRLGDDDDGRARYLVCGPWVYWFIVVNDTGPADSLTFRLNPNASLRRARLGYA